MAKGPGHQNELFMQSVLEQKDRVAVLLAEYTTLRTEIVHRTGFGFQLLAIGLVSLTWFFGERFSDWSWWYWVSVPTIAILVFLYQRANLEGIKRTARRVVEIETEINSRAGEHLLVWEAIHGAAGRDGWFLRNLICGLTYGDRTSLKPLDRRYIDLDEQRRAKLQKNGQARVE